MMTHLKQSLCLLFAAIIAATIVIAYIGHSSTTVQSNGIIMVQTVTIHHQEENTVTRQPFVKSTDGHVTSLLKMEHHHVVPNIVHFVWFGYRIKF